MPIVSHPRIVTLPCHEFTALARQRAFLTRRPNASRMRVPAPYVARRARRVSPVPRYAEVDTRPESERGWALASLALMVLVVVLACCAAGVRLH